MNSFGVYIQKKYQKNQKLIRPGASWLGALWYDFDQEMYRKFFVFISCEKGFHPKSLLWDYSSGTTVVRERKTMPYFWFSIEVRLVNDFN